MDSETFKSRQQFLNEFFSKDRVDFLSTLKYIAVGDFSLHNSISSDVFCIDTEAEFGKTYINRHIPFENYHKFLKPFIYFLYSFTRQEKFLNDQYLLLKVVRITYYSKNLPNQEDFNAVLDFPFLISNSRNFNFLCKISTPDFTKRIHDIHIKLLTRYQGINNEQYIRLGGLIEEPTQEYYEVEEDNKIINSSQCYKSEECVICLTNTPNVLFCNCGHLCYCSECEKLKNSNRCPMCKTAINIIRILE